MFIIVPLSVISYTVCQIEACRREIKRRKLSTNDSAAYMPVMVDFRQPRTKGKELPFELNISAVNYYALGDAVNIPNSLLARLVLLLRNSIEKKRVILICACV